MWLLGFKPKSPWPQHGIPTTKLQQVDDFFFFTLKGFTQD